MSLEICVLGSGSSGNATLALVNGSAMLIDAGIGPRAVQKRANGTGVDVTDLRAILLTHLDTDHFRPTWFTTVLKCEIPIHCHQRHVHALYRALAGSRPSRDARLLQRHGLIRAFDDQPFELTGWDAGAVRVHPLALQHDQAGTYGYRIDTGRHRLGYATDLGRVTDPVVDHFTDIDMLAIESNYDRQLQLASARPEILKRRIMGGYGHLSNDQSFDAVRTIFQRSRQPLRHVALLHLSRDCNHPRIVADTFGQDPEIAARVCITSATTRTAWLSVEADRRETPRQQPMMFG
ncbi:MAG: hypothetical protein CMJ49_09225 [Planctomycetaceae bacterium]|nr:hypothetical protein [Planctomycetaceae bacterium]